MLQIYDSIGLSTVAGTILEEDTLFDIVNNHLVFCRCCVNAQNTVIVGTQDIREIIYMLI